LIFRLTFARLLKGAIEFRGPDVFELIQRALEQLRGGFALE
jgi:hypothetical protein